MHCAASQPVSLPVSQSVSQWTRRETRGGKTEGSCWPETPAGRRVAGGGGGGEEGGRPGRRTEQKALKKNEAAGLTGAEIRAVWVFVPLLRWAAFTLNRRTSRSSLGSLEVL